MKLKTQPATGIISVVINTPKGPRSVSTHSTDMKEAKALVKAANIETIEVLSKAGQLNQALIQKLTIGGNMTVSKAIEEWSKWINETSGSDRTADTHIMFVNAWARQARTLNRKLVSITEGDISKWINYEDKAKLSTRRIRLSAVRHLFRFCSIRQYCNPDPSREVRIKAKLLTHDQKEPKVKTCFTLDEFQAVVDHLTEKIVDLMGHDKTEATIKKLDTARFWFCAAHIGRYSGLRLGDICTLEWASLRQPGKLIVWTDKKETRVEIPIGTELGKGIAAIPPNSKAHCFPEQDAIARHPRKRALLSVQFARILDEAGVEEHSFHDLRHTLATELNVHGNSLEEIAKALGHTSIKSTKGYIH